MVDGLKNVSSVCFIGNSVCMKRGLDAERVKQYFVANHCECVPRVEDADLIVCFTCAFVEGFKDTAFELVAEVQDLKKEMLVLGCLPIMGGRQFQECFHGAYLATRDMEQIDDLFPEFDIPFSSIKDGLFPLPEVITSYAKNIRGARAFQKTTKEPILRICYGCNNHCTYCKHPKALGPLRSKPLEECLRDYQRTIEQGYKEIRIHGNDTGGYGVDIGFSLPELLDQLDATAPLGYQWRLHDVSPKWFLRYADRIIHYVEKGRISQLALPLQSGSAAILKRMGRAMDLDAFERQLSRIQDANPSLSLATHIMVGFPGETAADFEMTQSLLLKHPFDFVMIFPFSPMEDTAAERFSDRCAEHVITERTRLLQEALEANKSRVVVIS